MNKRNILIVDDDEVLGRVLGRVLGQQGYAVALASNVAEAEQRAEEQQPALVLLDLSLPDGNGTDLGRDLRSRFPDQQQILMTGYPLRLREHPELAQGFARVFTKPLDLKELRQTVDALMNPSAQAASERSAVRDEAARPAAPREPVVPGSGVSHRSLWLRLAGVAALLVVLAIAVAAMPYVGLPPVQEWLHTKPPQAEPEKPTLARLILGNSSAIILPEDVVQRLGVRTATAERATATRPLLLDGYVGYDPNHSVTINTLFTGQIEKLVNYPDPLASRLGETVERPVEFKDPVKKGQVLAILYSKDLGEKKSELVNAWSQYNLDQKYYEEFAQLYKKGLTSEANVLQYRAAVQQDLNAVEKARRTLTVWQVSEPDMDALQKEAERLLAMDPTQRAQFRNVEQAGNWAKVEVKAPIDGIVVERNIGPGQTVDSSKDLYKIAQADRMIVYAHAYEDSMPALMQLKPDDRRWKVRVNADPNLDLPMGLIATIGSVDPNQHTIPLMGPIPNPPGARGERTLIAGQFVTATIQLPAAPNEVAIPTTALIEGSGDSVVFVQPDPKEPRYELRRVTVVRRTQEVVFTRWVDPDVTAFLAGWPAAAAPLNSTLASLFLGQIEPGEQVVTNGALLLVSELDDLRSKANEK